MQQVARIQTPGTDFFGVFQAKQNNLFAVKRASFGRFSYLKRLLSVGLAETLHGWGGNRLRHF